MKPGAQCGDAASFVQMVVRMAAAGTLSSRVSPYNMETGCFRTVTCKSGGAVGMWKAEGSSETLYWLYLPALRQRLSKKEAQLSKCVAPVRRERGKSKLLSISLFDFSPSLSFISSGRTYGLLMIKHYRGNFKAVSNSNFLYL